MNWFGACAYYLPSEAELFMGCDFKRNMCEVLEGSEMTLRIDYRMRGNARRYILRVNARRDGGCVTIPRGGCHAEARSFAKRNLSWLEETLRRSQKKAGSFNGQNNILFRGEMLSLPDISTDEVSLGGQVIRLPSGEGNLRARLKMKLWEMAKAELPGRVHELAASHGLKVKRVSVRNQRSRWGSCSVKGNVSLNWRLIQAPGLVRDYIIVHELMHLREMNHSARFWKLVYDALPQTTQAEQWLKKHSALLRDWDEGNF